MNIENLKNKALKNERLSVEEIFFLIQQLRNKNKQEIYKAADEVREKFMGNLIYLRGIIEFSNYCRKSCDYCGINSKVKDVKRYRIDEDEILKACHELKRNGQTTVVLQSGEDLFWTKEKMGSLIERIKKETDLAITISVGEREEDVYLYWKQCGMDRYLIRFETSNKEVFEKIHPDDNYEERIECIKTLKRIGVQTGSGFMIGLPFTDDWDIARDIDFCRELDLDMIGIGPFIANPLTPLKDNGVKHDIDFITGIISILRLANPMAHIPATTAFDVVLDHEGRQLALKRGANVFMPNSTPQKYRIDYQLYPDKPCVDESAGDCANCVVGRILSIGREIGKGPGHSIKTINN
ncbi:MAG: [FeFe] hydrogenase H-cluster radical SAM maturase HydE [Candidatus Muirbacterium halophilum]|nr:[FeFe] hydrogenase H-cluster radical SAM maturase HydE [Candidatus Muirbacterium halophilum]MCK9475336.1 [FeFe] hydrogenase H-cluster radical SAM maturase HydE [Candidatus Muirbacterium halophilum]